MVEYLVFELCKPDGESRCITIQNKNGSLYLDISIGNRGLYISTNIVSYHCGGDSEKLISSLLEPSKPYTWPRVIPSDYTPGKHIMGSDIDSWSLEYKEVEKKTTRHIRGKGDIPTDEPYSSFVDNLMKIIPDRETVEWFIER